MMEFDAVVETIQEPSERQKQKRGVAVGMGEAAGLTHLSKRRASASKAAYLLVRIDLAQIQSQEPLSKAQTQTHRTPSHVRIPLGRIHSRLSRLRQPGQTIGSDAASNPHLEFLLPNMTSGGKTVPTNTAKPLTACLLTDNGILISAARLKYSYSPCRPPGFCIVSLPLN